MDHGAHFYRCDFQVHSPRDRGWVGTDCVTEQDRKGYAASLILACRRKGLDAIAITDHHDLLFAKYIRDAARAERDDEGHAVPGDQQIVVFPGMELTLNVPCQALLLFDADFPDDLFSLVLTALAIAPNKDAETKTVETKRLDQITTLEMLRSELDKHAYLRNRYIILPNVSEGGADTLLRHGNAAKYAGMPCVGGYLDGLVDQHGIGNKSICEGKASEYGNKRIALFQTSDNRRADHADLGKHTTWVKWAVPTAEALRQACLAQESRIAQHQPELPAVAITALSVSNSAFLGPIQVEFNSQYNALIGGRGTGKSTILEYLRWALCDQLPITVADDELPNYQVRRKTLLEKTLQTVNGTVQVSFTVNGIPHVVRRNSTTDELQLKVGDAEFAACTEADIRSLLPVQAYSQKQLSNVSVRLEELSRFVEAPIRAQLGDLEKTFERAAAEMRQMYATLLRKRRLQKQITNDELLLESLNEQAENIRKSLTGLSEADTTLLAAKSSYERAEEVLDIWVSDVGTVGRAIDDMESALSDLPTKSAAHEADLPEGVTLAEIEKEIGDYIATVKRAIKEMKRQQSAFMSDDGVLKGTAGANVRKWMKALTTFNEKYAEAKGRASVHESRLEQLGQMEKRIGELRSTIGRTRREINGLGKPEAQYEQVRETWIRAKAERARLVQQECEKLTARSQGEIRASIRVGAGVDAVLQKFRAAVTGSGLRREKIDAIGELIRAAQDADRTWMEVLGELEGLAGYDPEDSGEKNVPACPALRSCGLANADLIRIAGKLDEDAWLEISLARLEDQPVFEYRARENDYIPFPNASAGQQATALLKALLNQPGPPLIIDQPEEDLDNPVMLQVVSQIWQAKKSRQLILSSHNANLVVNGDAELVVWCDYRAAGDHSGGHIRGTGAIDMPVICSAIKQVMEGGEAAFKLRKEKYGF
jgi:chromosome segregation protein